ncbi:hypothetical protein BDW72DRAFT_206485 [Aspergillus terricola var. indicus]
MALPLRDRRHRSFLEGVIERNLANRIFNEIMSQFEPSQPTDSGYFPVTLVRRMSVEQDLLDKDDGRIGLGQALSTLAPFPNLPSEQKDAIKKSLVAFAKYLVDNFFLPLKASAGRTPQPTPTLSWSTPTEVAIGTPQRIANLRKTCLIRDRHRCVITRRFDAQEAQTRYKKDGGKVKDDDDKSLLPERDTMAYLEAELSGNFEIAFEPDGTQPHTYRVDYVESERMGRVEKLPVTVSLFLTPNRSIEPPSPQLLAIHRAIGRILHLSAAGEYINDYVRDLEEMKGGEVMQNGSTRLDDYVWFRLMETSVY